MPAIHQINKDSRIITTTWEGDATDDECMESYKKYQEDIFSKPEYCYYNEFVNFANVTDFKLTAKGLMDLAKQAKTTDRPDIHTKLAIIVKSGLAYSFANLYATYRNVILRSSKAVQVFKNEEDALDWLSDDG